MADHDHDHDHEHDHAEKTDEKASAKPAIVTRKLKTKAGKAGPRVALPAKKKPHDHDDHAGHDHAGHDHAGHDHAGHDHAGHDHAGHDHAGHDHAGHDHHDHDGHDHHDHDHEGHDHDHHDHDHAPPKRSAPTSRAAETGGAAIQLPLSELLPGETDERGVFARYARALVDAVPGVSRVHLRSDGAGREICAHLTEEAPAIEPLAERMREVAAATIRRYQRFTWFVRGMESAQCAMVIEHVLGRTAGVLTADVAYAAERLVVEFDRETITKEGIEKRVEVIGYALEVPQAGHACSMHAHGGGLAPRLQMPLAFTAGGLLALGWGVEHFVPAPSWAPTVLYALALASGGFFPVRAALLSLKGRQVDVETLMVLAGAGAATLGAWFEGAFLLFLFSLGHAFEHRAMDRARRAIESLSALRPKVARVRRGTKVVDVPVAKIKRGDRILVHPGDRVPLDGVVRDGESSFDEAPITGESMPVAKHLGDAVYAGSINGEAGVELEVTKLSRESVLARIVDLVSQAEARKSATQRFAQRLERTFVPIVLVAAVALPVALYLMGLPLRDAVLRGVALLVAASPCALAISTPSAVLAAVASAARAGVLVKGGAHLEALGAVRTIAFDKTGTLTHGAPTLHEVLPLEGVTDRELLEVAAGAEGLTSHPLARAIVRGAAEREIPPLPAEDARAVHGKGLHAKVGGDDVAIGSLALFEGETIPEAITRASADFEKRGRTAIVVRRGARFLGTLAVADTMRKEAPAVVRALGALGIRRTIMLSGDNLRVARSVASAIGITEARAPLMPEGKVDAIRELAKEGGVAMIGDGVNDAPALVAASVGVAMGGAGSDAALETADIVLMGDALERLPFVVSLAREASTIIRQNVVIALGVSAVLVVASVLGIGSIAHAVVLHEGSTVVVVLNAMRLLARKPAA